MRIHPTNPIYADSQFRFTFGQKLVYPANSTRIVEVISNAVRTQIILPLCAEISGGPPIFGGAD